MAGRPSQLKDPHRSALLESIRKGAPPLKACESAGVKRSTYYGWQEKGRADQEAGKLTAFAEFLDDLRKAEADFIATTTAKIYDAGPKTWQAFAWLLERRFPELFGDNRHEIRAIRKELAEVMRRLGDAPTPPATTPNDPTPTTPPGA